MRNFFKKKIIASSLEMANPNPHDNNPLSNDPQDDQQDASQNNNAPTINYPPQGQDATPDFECCFTTMYPFQESVMSNLNRLDFRHLQLAGIQTPISQQLQKKHLILSKCDETLVIPGISPVTCSNTTQTVGEIKACHGLHHDGWGLRGRQEKWIEPTRLLKHVPKSDSLVQRSSENEEGHFDSFNVCIHCHERDRQRRLPYENLTLNRSLTTMCMIHCLEYVDQRPYNACRCKMFLEKYWRCHICSLDTLDELRLRAQSFGEDPFPNFIFDKAANVYINRATGNPRREALCPILGCTGLPWLSGPRHKQVLMCRACTAIFPQSP